MRFHNQKSNPLRRVLTQILILLMGWSLSPAFPAGAEAGPQSRPQHTDTKQPIAPQTTPESEPPLTEAQFFSLLQQMLKKQMTQGDVASQLESRGIEFEATDAVIRRAQTGGAQTVVIAALIRAEERRKRARYALPEPERPAPQLNRQPARGTDLGAEPTEEELEAAIHKLPFVEQARQYAIMDATTLPDFVVLQDITRYVQQPGRKWELRDTLTTEVRYEHDSGETIKVLKINNQPTNKSYEDVGGSTSVGDFSAQLASVFAPSSKADLKAVGEETYRGRKCSLYSYSVQQQNSQYELYGGYNDARLQKAVVGFQGTLWIDKETKHVLRVEKTATGIPRDFALSVAESVVEYDWITIGGNQYWLPINGEVLLGSDRDRYYMRNTIKFNGYRKFEGDVKIVD
ncbi:MAG: hypothetical protein K1Y36_01395 [Blastocatellia bacterium]|nr:hypothetical protein [Blastocatellia bacterium]